LKNRILYIFIFLSIIGNAQNIKLITYPASNGIEYKEGMRVYLGSGSNTDKSFQYISRNTSASDGTTNLPATWIGQFMELKRIKQTGTKNAGYKVYLICKGAYTGNYWIEIESAIEAGEVVNPKAPK
jgi:hypothetical protein